MKQEENEEESGKGCDAESFARHGDGGGGGDDVGDDYLCCCLASCQSWFFLPFRIWFYFKPNYKVVHCLKWKKKVNVKFLFTLGVLIKRFVQIAFLSLAVRILITSNFLHKTIRKQISTESKLERKILWVSNRSGKIFNNFYSCCSKQHRHCVCVCVLSSTFPTT